MNKVNKLLRALIVFIVFTTVFKPLLFPVNSFAEHLKQTNKNYVLNNKNKVDLWCRDRMAILRRGIEQASVEYSYGHFEKSYSILKKALVSANENVNEYFLGALTAKAMRRGLVLLGGIEAIADDDHLRLKTLNLFLYEYFNFINSVARNLDIPYYTPGDCIFCRFGKHKKFEKLFIKFSRKQIQMVLNTFIESGHPLLSNGQKYTVPHENQVPFQRIYYPLGSPFAFLKALEIMSSFHANDLRDSLYVRRFACSIGEIEHFSSRLHEFNVSKTGFPDEFFGVQFAATKAISILGSNCNGSLNHMYSDDRYSQHQSQHKQSQSRVLSQSFILEEGTSKSVNLHGSRYIQSLTISAYGIRREAMFDVFINGKLKQNIHVPPRDPTFYIPIDDEVHSLTLINRYGRVKVTKIEILGTMDNF